MILRAIQPELADITLPDPAISIVLTDELNTEQSGCAVRLRSFAVEEVLGSRLDGQGLFAAVETVMEKMVHIPVHGGIHDCTMEEYSLGTCSFTRKSTFHITADIVGLGGLCPFRTPTSGKSGGDRQVLGIE